MSLEKQKLDITDRVVGKIQNGELVLYLENERIGKMPLPNDCGFQLEGHHYECTGDKIFQNVSVPGSSDPKYTDCDEGGWC